MRYPMASSDQGLVCLGYHPFRHHDAWLKECPNGTGTSLVDGAVVAEGCIEKTVPFLFSADETMDIGGDSAMPVTEDYAEGEKNQFTGHIAWVRIDLEDDDVSHLEPEHAKYRRVLARQ